MELILASQSPRRRELLERVTTLFSVVVSGIEERRDPTWTVEELPRQLALQKAMDVSKTHPSALVIGADTIVSLDGAVLGKPRDEADAAAMLRALSGRTHLVYTGVAFCRAGRECSSFVQRTEVDFYPLQEQQIQRYLATGEPFDKAGAYGIQEQGGLFVKSIRGDYFNVMGFPMARTARELERLLGKDRQEL
ncbi:MAG: Maf family protein [Oscillospiraceae bacterium]|nr:Maf family protein [Oscillospiraceae bacterium]